jgi:hypothetical protein
MIATATRLVEGVLRPDDRVGRGDRGGGAGAAFLGGDLAVHRSACPVVTGQGPGDRSRWRVARSQP